MHRKTTRFPQFLISTLALIMLISCTTVAQRKTDEVQLDFLDKTEKQTIVILATGGTIAGSGEEGKESGYTSGVIGVDQMITAVPALQDIAHIEGVQVCNINSDDITSSIWINLANTINALAENPNIAGFVITHGTDTMEETAYFLNLTVKTDKPVVLTGSMRPATSLSADGAMNLYQAVCTAAAPQSKGKGVLAVFSDRIYSARAMQKISTYAVMAIAAGETGSIGIVRDNTVFYYENPGTKHTTSSEFTVEGFKELPLVPIIYFAADTDPGLLSYAAEHYKGLVIAGAGAGEFSKEFIAIIEKLSIPVVICSRIDDGIITQDALLCKNTIPGNTLPPQKAAILLRLALTRNYTKEDLNRIYTEY